MKQERYHQIIAQIRKEFEAWGFDTSQMTDDEIARGVLRFAKIIAKFGFGIKNIAEAFERGNAQV